MSFLSISASATLLITVEVSNIQIIGHCVSSTLNNLVIFFSSLSLLLLLLLLKILLHAHVI